MSRDAPSRSESVRRSPREVSRLFVISLALGAAVGGALAGCHPTGTPVVDQLETAAFAAGFTLLVARSSRGTWLVLGVGCVLLARGWLLVPAGAVMVVAFGTALMSRSRRRIGALIGALAVQVVLRWPPTLIHGLPSLAGSALLIVVGVSAWRRSSRRTRRTTLWVLGGIVGAAVVVSVPMVVATLIIRGQALAAEQSARAALAVIGSGSSSSVVADLRVAANDAGHSDSLLDWWLMGGVRAVPILAQQDRFLAGSLRSAGRAATVGAREAPAVNYRRLGYHHGQIDLARLDAMVRPMSILTHQLAVTDRQLAGVGSPWLVGPLQDRAGSFTREIGRALHGADLATQAARLLPGMLGESGTRSYLVAFMTPSEARGYDGLVGSYGLLQATNGHIRLTVSGSIEDVQRALPSGGARLVGVSDFLARYGAFHPGEFPQDATYSPDLPTVADVLDQLYRQAGGAQLDGVLALDPKGLAALLHFTGPIEVSGLPTPLTQANAASVLLTGQYTTFDVGAANQDIVRHDFLQDALHVAFDKLVAGSLPAPKELAAVLDPPVVAGRISFWSFHQDEQPLLRRVGLDGSFPSRDGGNLLGLTTQNTGNNKIDTFLHTSMIDRVAFDPSTGSVDSTVTIHLRNAAPASGLPPILIDSPADPNLAVGTNRTWLTLYSPLSVTQVSVDGRPGSMSSEEELGVRAFSMYVDVPSGSTTTVEVSLAGLVDARTTLPVTVRLQPSANPEAVAVEVTPAGPWRLTTTSGSGAWELSPAMRQRRLFRFAPA